MNSLAMMAARVSDTWGVLLLDGAVKVLLVVGVTAVVAHTFRNRSAAVRHLVWTLGVLGVLVVPVLSWLIPGVRVPLPIEVPEPARAVEWPVTVPVLRLPALEVVATPAAPRHLARSRVTVVEPLRGSHVVEVGESHAVDVGESHVMELAGESHAGHAASVAPRAARAPRVALAVAPWGSGPVAGANVWWAVVLVWLAGVVVCLFRLVSSMVRLAVASRSARRIESGRLIRIAEEIAWDMGVDTPVQLLSGDEATMPMTWGIRRPVVLLPWTAGGWSRVRLEMVLRHELAHVVRADALTQLLADVACALHWYNPLVWFASKRMRAEREHACDDYVLESGSRASAYATELLDIARTLRLQGAMARAAIAMARPSHLKTRLSAVLAEDRRRQKPTRGLTAAAAVCALGIVVPLAALEPSPLSTMAPLVADVAPSFDKVVIAVPRPAMRPSQPGGVTIGPLTVVPLRVAQEPAVCRRADRGSASTNVDNDDWRIRWDGTRCSVEVRLDGRVTFNEDFTAIVGLASGGLARFEDEFGERVRRLEIRADGNGLRYTWRVNDSERPFDGEARAWLSAMLVELFRTSGIAAEERAASILRRHGPEGLLAEIEHMRSDWTRRRYYQALLSADRLDSRTVAHAIRRAGNEIRSDHELSSLLVATAQHPEVTADVRAALIGAVASLESDHERRRALAAVITQGQLSREDIVAMLALTQDMRSDHERASLLLEVTQQAPDARTREAYLRSATAIGSDHEKTRVLTNLLERGELDTGEQALLLEAAASIRSDHERANLLMTMLRTQRLEGTARDAFITSMNRIESKNEHGRVASALMRAESRAPRP
jgi:beta-lactamase regulating signal transducer with metallopeptidase domain